MVRGATLHKFGDGRESVPRTVRASLWLLIGGYVVGLALSPFDPRPWPRVPDKSTLIIAGILGIGIIWGIVFICIPGVPGPTLGQMDSTDCTSRGYSRLHKGHPRAFWDGTCGKFGIHTGVFC